MLKINKFENVYGIKTLSGANDFEKINVIYAPNGTAKSSISDALLGISRNYDISDVYGNGVTPSYELEIDGCICNENNQVPFNIIKYSGVSNYEINNANNYGALVLSETVKQSVLSSLNSLNKSSSNVKNIIESLFPKKKKNVKDSLSIVASGENDDEFYINLIENLDLLCDKLPFEVTEDMFINLVSSKTMTISQTNEVKENSEKYFEIINKKISDTILDENFTIENLQSFYNAAITNNFFSTTPIQRAIIINGVIYDAESMKALLDNKINEIYGSSEAKTQFEVLKKSFKGANKIVKELQKEPKIVQYLSDYVLFVNRLFVSLASPVLEALIEEKDNIKKEKEKLKKISENYVANDNKLFSIWQKFQSRFKFKKFDLGIENEFNAVAGISMPNFVKYIPNTKEKIDNPSRLRFSTGEIKTFYIINAILEIERNIMLGNNFTIILDDAVDSFDYKNKYGIIDYLLDIKDNPNIQIIIFTHNFDFYRSTILALGKKSVKQYFAYKNSVTNEVSLYNVGNKGYYLEIANFNSWKACPTVSQYFALIPFARNVLQLQKSSKDPDVQKIDSYLHYDYNNESIDFSEINNILDTKMSIKLSNGLQINDSFLKKLDLEVSNILSNTINETELELKLTLGVYIRIFLERYLYKIIFDNTACYPLINDVYCRTPNLIKNAGTYLGSYEKTKITEANVIAPSYVHANSFMYEPLIDVGVSELMEVAKWLQQENLKWSL